MSAPATLVELLRDGAARHPDRTAFIFLLDGEREGERLTYAGLDREARRIAAVLRGAGLAGERALLLFPPGLAFVAAYFGCLYAGVVAVPVYPPRSNRNLDRVQSIVADADARAVLATGDVIASLAKHAEAAPQLAALRWIAADLEFDAATAQAVPGEDAPWVDAGVKPDDVAFLQYTSGSTSTPKGVRVTHGGLICNEAMMRDAFGHREGLVVAGWLPVYHDMGLIGNVLHPLFMGGTCVLMSPAAFLQRPARWLEAVSRYGAETSGGPNFAYDLCAERVSAEEKAALDLGAWRVAFCGAEPVRAATLERFAAAFGECGFRRDAFYPCYGLAEATLFVAGGRSTDPPVVRGFRADALEQDRAVPASVDDAGTATLVGCGFPWREGSVEIVRPETGLVCAEGGVGEVWAMGPHIAHGYWNRPDATAECFDARLADGRGPYLRTGDLGFVSGGELFITGRVKDLIILRGRNLYPQDIEATAGAAHPALQPGGAAAFSVDVDGEERLVIVHEVRRTALRSLDAAQVARRVREEVAAAHEAAVHDVVLIGTATLPKTSSGKVQRQACRRAYLAGSLDPVGGAAQAAPAPAPAVSGDAGCAPLPLEALVRDEAARVLGISAESVRPELALTALGLDSVRAARLAARLEDATGVPLDPVALLEPLPLRELVAVLAALAAERSAAPAADTAEVGDLPFALSPGQRALWFLHRLAPESAAYNLAVAVSVDGPLDADAVFGALRQVSARHAALRTVLDDAEPVQRVLSSVHPSFVVEDASGWGDDALRARLEAEARRPFAFADGPPVRAHLFRLADDRHVVMMAAHHAVMDFRSLEIVFDELFAACGASGDGSSPDARDAQYPRFVRWQGELLAGPEGERLRARLAARLADAPTVLALPTDRPRPAVQGNRGAAHAFAFDAGLSARLHELARAEGVTPYVLLLAAFQVLLHRWSGQDDFLVGSPASGRTRPEFAGTVGYLVNPVVVRARLDGDPSFRELLSRTRGEALAALAAQAYPFEQLVNDLQPERDASRTPLVQALFVLQQADRLSSATACALGVDGVREARGALTLTSLAVETGAAQFDLALAMGEVNGTLAGSLRYDADLFDAATIGRMAAHFTRLLQGIAAAPETAVARLALLPPEEMREVVAGFNATGVAYANADAPLHRLFEAQAARTPDAVAVAFENDAVTYAELDRRANSLAHRLRAAGVGVETRVGVCAERSVEMVVALLAVLKAGGAYVPVDPGYPAERIAYMLSDSAVPVILTQRRLADALPAHAAEVILLDEESSTEAVSSSSPDVEVAADALAYVIYTSGSTGRPKGAMNAHRGVVNRLLWMQAQYGLTAADVVLQKTPFSFDVSVWEFFWPLITGAKLVMARPEGHRDPAYLSSVIEREGVTTLHFVPSMLRAFVEHGGAGRCASVRRVMSSGEALPADLVGRFFAAMPGAELHNLYGPTEAAVDVTFHACTMDDGVRAVPIGRPVANTRIYVVDRRGGDPAPVGVPGELLIGGVQVGRGYLNRPALTAEKFVPDPFSASPGARVYRTGDLARWRPDGAVEYLGRLDHQVKVRGFRIEPGEIEAVLAAHPSVRECTVIAREDAPGDVRLVAYAAARGDAPPVEALRAFVRERLPEHMVPAAFVMLDALPLSPNGKVDRRALPAPDRSARGAAAYVAPRSAVEESLAVIFAGVLGVERVGVHDDFFALGGSSLLAVRVGAQVQDEFGVSLPLHTLFQAPTVEALSVRIATAQLEAQPDDEILRLLAELEAAGMAGD